MLSVDERDAQVDLANELRRSIFQITAGAFSTFLNRLALLVRSRSAAKEIR
jgi:hypothetical protein